jgi:small subunit ribosomal protein S9
MAEQEKNQQAPDEGAATATAEQPVEPKPAPRTAPPVPEGQHYFWGIGRRKKAIARVRMRPGNGTIEINKRPLDEYFSEERDRNAIHNVLQAVGMDGSWDVFVNVGGGGYTGQAGAVTLGMARALRKAVPDAEHALRERHLLTRDARMKERKKYGQKGARKRFQFSKR